MKQIPLTKEKFALVDDEDYNYLSQFKWCISNGYAVGHVPGTWNKVRSMVSLIVKAKSKQQVDHINMNTLDNRRKNLRLVSKSQNMMNKPKQSNNTSGFKGVSLDKRRLKWRANIQANGNNRWLGYFNNKKEAFEAYKKAAFVLHKEYTKI